MESLNLSLGQVVLFSMALLILIGLTLHGVNRSLRKKQPKSKWY